MYIGEVIIAFVIVKKDSECFNHNLKCHQHIIQEMEVVVCQRTGNGLDWLENVMSALYKLEYPRIPRTVCFQHAGCPWAGNRMLQSAMDCSESGGAEPHLEGTTQRQKDRSHLKHAFSLVGYARCVKFYVKMKDQVCGSVKSQELGTSDWKLPRKRVDG
jgi:hypothetical protein